MVVFLSLVRKPGSFWLESWVTRPKRCFSRCRSVRLIWLLSYSFLLAAHSPIDAHINCAHMCVCLPFAFACDDLVERSAWFLPKVWAQTLGKSAHFNTGAAPPRRTSHAITNSIELHGCHFHPPALLLALNRASADMTIPKTIEEMDRSLEMLTFMAYGRYHWILRSWFTLEPMRVLILMLLLASESTWSSLHAPVCSRVQMHRTVRP